MGGHVARKDHRKPLIQGGGLCSVLSKVLRSAQGSTQTTY